MKYVLSTLVSYAVTHYVVGLMIRGQLAEVAEGLRHQPDAPTPGQYLREMRPYVRRAQRQYSLMAGTVVALLAGLAVSWVA
ncbi:hypothetical protein [Pseudomonas sp. NPDC089401]|uniref:hypothetical protein n=1 Tax=Pseudomonas sp. NPDC089401 TaxID=3364462 RepID=UPI00381FA295